MILEKNTSFSNWSFSNPEKRKSAIYGIMKNTILETKIISREKEKNNLEIKSTTKLSPLLSSLSKKGMIIKEEMMVATVKKIKSGILKAAIYISKTSPAPNLVEKILSLIIAKKVEVMVKKAIKNTVFPTVFVFIFKKLNIIKHFNIKNKTFRDYLFWYISKDFVTFTQYVC